MVVRTLDAGADKPLPFADLGAEANPALGRRGLRLSQVREDLLATQLAALAAAHRVTAVRAALRLHDLDTCRRMADIAVSARTATGSREAVLAMADPALPDML